PVKASHIFTYPSPDVYTLSPKGLKIANLTRSILPLKIVNGVPVWTSHIIAVVSLLDVTILVPSTLNCTEFTLLLCPENVCNNDPDATSQSFAVPSPLAVTTLVPSGLNVPSK